MGGSLQFFLGKRIYDSFYPFHKDGGQIHPVGDGTLSIIRMEKQQEGLPLIRSGHQAQTITKFLIKTATRLVIFNLTISIIGGILLKRLRGINQKASKIS